MWVPPRKRAELQFYIPKDGCSLAFTSLSVGATVRDNLDSSLSLCLSLPLTLPTWVWKQYKVPEFPAPSQPGLGLFDLAAGYAIIFTFKFHLLFIIFKILF